MAERDQDRGAGQPDVGPLQTTISNISRPDGTVPSALDMFGNLSVTSQFKVSLHFPKNGLLDLEKWLSKDGLLITTTDAMSYDFLCSEASLPGASFNAFEEMGSRQGVIETFAGNRSYPTFDMTFYVDNQYRMIRLFEEWMNFINPIYTNNGMAEPNLSGSGYGGAKNRPDFFRLRYPDQYRRIISITKFERDFHENPDKPSGVYKKQTQLTYRMIDSFPVNLTSIPVTYDGSIVTKTRVSFSYSRYVIERSNAL